MSTSNPSKIIIICGDPGGANALVPVIKQLYSEKKMGILVFAYRQAIDIMKKNIISFSVLDETITPSDVQEIFQLSHPKVIITGTSFKPIGLEVKFIEAAKKNKIPCLTVLDFWANYSIRFSNQQGNLIYVPDKIAIMDERANYDMLNEGFHPDSLIVTGQPAFDILAEYQLNFNKEKNQKIRFDLQIQNNELFVVFVSQPLSKLYGNDESNPEYLGYTEKTVLNSLIKVLEILVKDSKTRIFLFIRPHPRERAEDYKNIRSDFIRILVSNRENPLDIMMASDLVIGMNTELLVEACFLGCMVVSLQPGLRYKDTLPTNIEGYSVPVYTKEEIMGTIRMMLMDPDIRSKMKNKLKQFKQDGHATDRVVNVIHQMIEGNEQVLQTL